MHQPATEGPKDSSRACTRLTVNGSTSSSDGGVYPAAVFDADARLEELVSDVVSRSIVASDPGFLAVDQHDVHLRKRQEGKRRKHRKKKNSMTADKPQRYRKRNTRGHTCKCRLLIQNVRFTAAPR